MSTPLVSVIMNCWNGERYLREAIASVFAQTYSNWEIIFWDNASTDGSAAIAKSFGHRIRYFRGNATIPLGAARNKAVNEARGEWIAFLDCDDVWLPQKLEKQIQAAHDGDYAVCYSGCIEMDAEGKPIRTLLPMYRSGSMFGEQLRQFDISVPAVIVRKSALDASGLKFDDNIRGSEEYWLFMQLAAKYPFCVVSEPLAKWRIHADSLTSKVMKHWAAEREFTLDTIRRTNPGIEKKYAAEFAEAYARANYYRARHFLSTGDKAAAREVLRKIATVSKRYLFLYVLSLCPDAIWNYAHREGVKRRLIRFLGVSRYAR